MNHISIEIDVEKCKSCHKCSEECINEVLIDTNLGYNESINKASVLDVSSCSLCMKCVENCTENAIDLQYPINQVI